MQKTTFLKKNYFSKTMFFNKKQLNWKLYIEKTSKTEKWKNRKINIKIYVFR